MLKYPEVKMYKWLIFLVLLFAFFIQSSCKKDKAPAVNIPVQVIPLYADSILYIKNANQNIVYPVGPAQGSYTSFPDGLKIDQSTGAIDVNNSETGLKFKVTFTDQSSGNAKTAYVTISGINYRDKIFNLAAGDSIATPIYNADAGAPIPQINNGSTFDTNSGCKNAGIEVNPVDGTINLAKSVRDQLIDTGSTQEVKLQYKINDQSREALNGLNVKIYFYRNAGEIPQYLQDILTERKTTILAAPINRFASLAAAPMAFTSAQNKPGRPRPPCIIVVSR
ncbi:hypothetical protein [Mucilaginibacter gotjawali]|uniref:Uncharacterized protein n=1 Tax=Mucilaginibacter gotjawali TaxID=1550579 RepID=A0A839SEH6_9SPHI|nr:hypothetical protein [Mucilaginibacter gotjawali]MBB3056695.1 hypothetical protein [Mucilaginibacter gotjawali]